MYLNLKYLILILIFFLGCKKTDDYGEVRKTLENVLVEDQRYRQPIYNPEKQNIIDEKNIKIVTKIIDSLGWLGKDKIGKNANNALYIVIQHAHEFDIRKKYLPIMKDAVKKGNAEKSQLANMIDRFELLNNRKQIYGTQISYDVNGNAYIINLIDSVNVNLRRKSMNLDPIENYIRICDSLNINNIKK